MSNFAQSPYPEPPRWLRKLPVISPVVALVVDTGLAFLVTRHVRLARVNAQARQHWADGFYAGSVKGRNDHLYFQLPSAADTRSYAEICCPPLAEGDRKEWTDGFVVGYNKVYEKFGGPKAVGKREQSTLTR